MAVVVVVKALEEVPGLVAHVIIEDLHGGLLGARRRHRAAVITRSGVGGGGVVVVVDRGEGAVVMVGGWGVVMVDGGEQW